MPIELIPPFPFLPEESPGGGGGDVVYLKSSNDLYKAKVRRCTVYVWTDIVETSDNRFIRGTGSHTSGLIPDYVPWPSTGQYLGYLNGGLTITPTVGTEPVPRGNSPSPHREIVKTEGIAVSSNLVFTSDVDVTRYLRVLNGGPWSESSEYGGGAIEAEALYHNLLLVMCNVNKPESHIKAYAECWLFFRGKFAETSYQYGGWHSDDAPFQMNFKVLAAADMTTPSCDRNEGMTMYHHWYEDVLTGGYISPKSEEYGGTIW